MSPNELPFNVEIFQPTQAVLDMLKPVSSVDYYENTKGDLHEEGLFSISIFGRMGDEARDKRFSYIDIKTQIFHPIIYNRLIRLKKLYQGILNGDQYAVWDEARRDFFPANALEGQTGFAFFCEHWKKIQFNRNTSDVREMRVKVIEKYRDRAMTSKILVIPAGMRDIEVDENGRTNVNEINALYRKLISISRVLPDNAEPNDPNQNLARRLLQACFNDIYDLIETMLSGKEGFFQSKWSSRNVVNSTRNVITAMDTSVAKLGARNAPRFTDTIVGLWQLSKAVLPVTIHHLKNGYLSEVFAYGNRTARLVDPTTLKAEMVDVSPDAFDRWNTVEGLERVVSSYKEFSLRSRPVTVDERYLALLYAPKGAAVFKLFSDIDELPEGADRKDVRPVNLMELLYLSGYKIWNDQVGTVTRYPVTNVGSCYPTTVYVKTTVVGEMRRELGDDWQPLPGDEHLAPEFPTYQPLAYQDSLVIPSTRLAGLGADNLLCTAEGKSCALATVRLHFP
ncbi:hypothetical protein LUCX_4 [Xanthomonas phage vB_XciM_LucasX]|nr:hypothetical protein LUCX_4 [Xanthomonas phage vB_XciM_LucasX]